MIFNTAFFDNCPDTLIGLSSTLQITNWNSSAARQLGYVATELVGAPFSDILQQENLLKLKDTIERILRGEPSGPIELDLVDSKGSTVCMTFSVTPLASQHESKEPHSFLLIGRDAAPLKRLESFASDISFRLKAIVNSSPSALSLKTPEGVYVLANPNLQRIHHKTEAQIIGLTDFDLYSKEIAENFRQNDQLVLSTNQKQSVEEWIPFDGTTRNFISHIFPISDEHGSIMYICRISLDITEKRQVEVEAFKLAQAVEQSPVSILITSANGEIDFVNSTFLETTGYKSHEVIGKTPDFLKSGKTPMATYESLREALRLGKAWRGEFINRKKNGEEYIDSATISALRTTNAEITNYVAVQQDVTDLKRTQGMLKESEERLNLAMQGSQDGLWDWDVINNKMYWSHSWKNMLGYADHELNPSFESWETLVHPDDLHTARETLEGSITDQSRIQYSSTFRLAHKKGYWVPILARGLILRDENGHAIRMVGTHIDRTEINKLQQELNDAWYTAQSAADSNDAKSKFLFNLNRDIRTPLSELGALTRAISQDLPLETATCLDLERLQLIVQDLILTMNNLDDFTRLDEGELVLKSEVVNIEKTLDSISKDFATKCDRKKIRFQMESSIDTNKSFYGDSTRIMQIVNNLLSNALKFTNSGEIKLSIGSRLDLSKGADKKEILRIEVSDTGVGIPKEKLSKLFKPFIHAHYDAANVYGGSGLGLTIVKSLAQLMGGDAICKASTNEGTTMQVEFPIQDVNKNSGHQEISVA